MLAPPAAGDPYDLLDPALSQRDTEAVRLGLLNWQVVASSVVPDAVDIFTFFSDPDLL